MNAPGKATYTSGPWVFLELGRTEEEFNRGRAFTVGGGPNNDDIANVFSCDDASVSISREEAAANACLIAEAPNLLEQLRRVEHTLSVHGKVDADTVLHVAISAAIRKAESAQ